MERIWSTCTDEEVVACRAAFMAEIGPDEAAAIYELVFTAIAPGELENLLGAVRAGLPEPAFDSLVGVARRTLTPAAWEGYGHTSPSDPCASDGLRPDPSLPHASTRSRTEASEVAACRPPRWFVKHTPERTGKRATRERSRRALTRRSDFGDGDFATPTSTDRGWHRRRPTSRAHSRSR